MSSRKARLSRIVIALAVALAALLIAVFFWRDGQSGVHYVTAPVTRGAIVRSVIATGTVNPVTTVQVGSYVSGPIQAIYADFNAPVKAGQLIAKIDPRPFEMTVEQDEASLANARAQLNKDLADMAYKKITLERNQKLLEAAAVSQDTVDSARSAYLEDVAQVGLDHANIQQQTAAVKAAKVQLNYTNIISPVNGTVVSRNVDVGQTVASSFQTPTLFLIAKDLTQMQVDTNVSESDIGGVLNGETGEFKVDAFPNRSFTGAVTQVRQAPITVQNVVTYDVVVTVANPELLLKPGMTANMTIITAKRDDVVRIPEQALRFRPRPASGARAGEESKPPPHSHQARVWTVADDQLTPVTVTTGLDDGNNIELLSGNLKPGEEVVTDELRESAERRQSSPFSMHVH